MGTTVTAQTIKNKKNGIIVTIKIKKIKFVTFN